MIIGSLTTPKCNEAVTWIIFPDTIPISLSQMAKFRSLSNLIEGLLLVDNYRHLQPVGNRKVFIRSVSSRFLMLDKIQTESEEEGDDPNSIWYYNWASKIYYNFYFSSEIANKNLLKWLTTSSHVLSCTCVYFEHERHENISCRFKCKMLSHFNEKIPHKIYGEIIQTIIFGWFHRTSSYFIL